MKLWAFASALVLALTTTPLAAEVYKWTDEDGQVHYTQEPPPEDVQSSDSETVEQREQTEIELPERALREYCADLKKIAYKIGRAMRRGASTTDMISLSGDSVGNDLANSLVSYVSQYEGTDVSSQDIANQVHQKCMRRSYSRYVEEYWERKYPDRPLPGTEEYEEAPAWQR